MGNSISCKMVRKHKSILRARNSFFGHKHDQRHHKGKGEKTHLSHEEQGIMRKTFAIHDTDQDGLIDVDDLVTIARKFDLHSSSSDIQSAANDADTDNDGKLNVKEYVAVMTPLMLEKENQRHDHHGVFSCCK